MRSGLKSNSDSKKLKSSSQSSLNLSSSRRNFYDPVGLLVLLTGPSSDGQDLVISAARRRYSDDPLLEFPSRISTRTNVHDAEHIGVARSVFHSIEAHKGFAVAWSHEDVSHGLTTGSLTALEAGRIVVVAVSLEAIAQFREIWPKVEIIQMGSDLDGARPQTRVWRSCYSATQSSSVLHSRNMAQAVRTFLYLLDGLRKQHLVCFSP